MSKSLSSTDDEVARRMGSSFSEGAIQQHIAKLRNQMAELNVAPVPGPPRRGSVTKRPSSVYTQKGRAGAPPPDPLPPSKARARTRTQADDDGQGANGKARPRRRATTRNIKRSASDVGDSDEEFAGASEDDFQPEEVAGSKKRKQSGGSRGRATASRRVSNSQAAAMSKTNDIMRALSDADARFDAMQYGGNDGGHQVPGQDNMFNIHNSVEGNDGNAHSTFTPRPSFSGFAGYVGNAGQGEEEEEEELPLIARNQLLARQAPAPEPLPFSQEEQISPTFTSHMVSIVTTFSTQTALTKPGNASDANDAQAVPTVQCSRSRRIQLQWFPTTSECPKKMLLIQANHIPATWRTHLHLQHPRQLRLRRWLQQLQFIRSSSRLYTRSNADGTTLRLRRRLHKYVRAQPIQSTDSQPVSHVFQHPRQCLPPTFPSQQLQF